MQSVDRDRPINRWRGPSPSKHKGVRTYVPLSPGPIQPRPTPLARNHARPSLHLVSLHQSKGGTWPGHRALTDHDPVGAGRAWIWGMARRHEELSLAACARVPQPRSFRVIVASHERRKKSSRLPVLNGHVTLGVPLTPDSRSVCTSSLSKCHQPSHPRKIRQPTPARRRAAQARVPPPTTLLLLRRTPSTITCRCHCCPCRRRRRFPIVQGQLLARIDAAAAREGQMGEKAPPSDLFVCVCVCVLR